MRGFVGILVVLLVALVSGAIGFQAGVAANIGTTAGTTVPAYAWWWWGFPHLGGFLFGLLFLFLFIGLFAFAFGGRRRGPWGRGYRGWYGPYGGPMDDPSDPRRQWIADAHRRLHQDDLRQAPGAASPAATSAGQDANGIPPAPPAAG